VTISGDKALARLLLCKAMKLNDLFAALDELGGFGWKQSKRKQSHWMVRRTGCMAPFNLPVGHDGEVAEHWVRKLVRHFALDETGKRSGEEE